MGMDEEPGDCPACKRDRLQRLNEIVHADNAVTTYWRCARCSHVQVTRSLPRFERGQLGPHAKSTP